MSRFKAAVLAASVAAAFAAPALTAAPPTQAACTATIKVGNVSVSSTNPYNVKGTLTNACGATNAGWDMDGGSSYAQTLGGWYFSGTTTDYSYYYPGTEPLGSYKAAPTGGYDNNFNPVPQNTAYFAIKLASKISVSGYRSGNSVYVRAYVARFNTSLNYGLGGWQKSASRNVTFWYWHNGWHAAGSRYTGSNGWTSYLRIYAPTHRSFRAHVSATPAIWDRTSGSIYR